MKRSAIIRSFFAVLSILLLVSCEGNTTASTKRNDDVANEITESKMQIVEEQPYERYRNTDEEIVESEEQQIAELDKAFKRLKLQYDETEELALWTATSLQCLENEENGRSCIAPMLGILGPSTEPVLFIAFNHISEEYLEMDTVEINTNEYRYTYKKSTFVSDIQKDKVLLSDTTEKMEELALRLATEDDIDMLIDILESDEVLLRFEKFDTAKPAWDECMMPEEDKQAITDVLNAYYLYLNASEMARAKVISSIEQ